MGTQLTDDEILALPKVDLHLHLVGSAAPHTVAELAARHPEAGVPPDVGLLKDFYAFRDFAHFIEVYTLVSALVRAPEDITEYHRARDVLGLDRDELLSLADAGIEASFASPAIKAALRRPAGHP